MINLLQFVPKEWHKSKLLKDLEKIWYMIFLLLYAIGSVFMRELSYGVILSFLVVVFLVETALTLKLYIDIREILLFAGFLSYYLIMKDEHPFQVPFIFLLSYMIMKQFILNGGKLYKRRIFQIFVIVGICLCLFGFLEATSLYRRPLRANNIVFKDWREIYIEYFWNNKIVYYSTHWTIYVIIVLSLAMYSLTILKSNPLLSCALFFLSVLVNIVAFYVDIRNVIVISFLVFFISNIIYFLKNRRNKYIKIIYITMFLICFVFLLIIYVFYLPYINELFNNERLLESIKRNGGIIGNIRFTWQIEVIRQLFHYPFGGIQVTITTNQAHNFWLDIAKDAGLIPFFFLTVFLIISAVDAVKLIVRCELGEKSCIFLPMIFISYTLYNMIEPTVYTVLVYLPLYYMTSAAIRATNIKKIGTHKCGANKKALRERVKNE